MKKIIIVLGSNGMLGKYVYKYFLSLKNYNVIGLNRKDIDASKDTSSDLKTKLIKYQVLDINTIVINCMGMIKSRKDIDDIDFIYVNSIFPRILANACDFLGFKIIHPTTDCVFDGLKGKYDENNLHNATDVYGKTKSLGEPENATVIRTSIIGEEINQSRSLIEWIKSNKDKKVFGYTNHTWNGITCLQFAKVCENIIDNNLFWNGVKHIYSPNSVSKLELVNMVSDIYNLNIEVESKETSSKCNRTLSSISKVDLKDMIIPDLQIQIQNMKDFSDELYCIDSE